MNELESLLAAPEFQSAIAPFAVALVSLLVLRRVQPGLGGLCVTLGFLASVLLINGVTVMPLTGTRKIMLVTLAAGPVALVLARIVRGQVQGGTLALIAIVAAGWVFLTVLKRKSGIELGLYACGAVVYAGWLTMTMHTLNERPTRAGAAGLCLGLGTGVTAIFGASALLGQLGLALGAAAGGFVLIAAFLSDTRAGSELTFTLALGCALLGLGGLMFASLPWFALLPLAAIPLIARVPVGERLPGWLRAALITACTAVPAVCAVLATRLGTGY